MQNFIILPTTDTNPVSVPFLLSPKGKLVKHSAGGEFRKLISFGYIPHHLYKLSDEELKEGDWKNFKGKFTFKVIASTDESLIDLDNICKFPLCGGYQTTGNGQCSDCKSENISSIEILNFLEEYNKENTSNLAELKNLMVAEN